MNPHSQPQPARRYSYVLLLIALIVAVAWWMYAKRGPDPAAKAHSVAAAQNTKAERTEPGCTDADRCVESRSPSAAPADDPTFAQTNAGEIDYLRMLAERLERERDGRSQALAALLLRVADDRERANAATAANDRAPQAPNREDAWQRLSRNALALSPDDAAVAAWLSFGGNNPTERNAMLAHWQRVEPWNLAPLLAALPQNNPDTRAEESAQDRADLDEADTLFLRSLEPITGYDTKLNVTRHAVIAAVRRYPPTPKQWDGLVAPRSLLYPSPRQYVDPDMFAIALGMELWVKGVNTPFSALFRACKREALAQVPQRYAACVALGQRLQQRSDTLIGEIIGISLLRHAALHAKDRKAVADTRAMRDRLDWLTTQYGRMGPEPAAQPSAAQSAAMQDFVGLEVAALMDGEAGRIPYSEQDLMRAVLAAVAVPATPPPGWRSGFEFPDEGTPQQTQP